VALPVKPGEERPKAPDVVPNADRGEATARVGLAGVIHPSDPVLEVEDEFPDHMHVDMAQLGGMPLRLQIGREVVYDPGIPLDRSGWFAFALVEGFVVLRQLLQGNVVLPHL